MNTVVNARLAPGIVTFPCVRDKNQDCCCNLSSVLSDRRRFQKASGRELVGAGNHSHCCTQIRALAEIRGFDGIDEYPFRNDIKARGVNYVAPPMWVLVTLNGNQIVPSDYALEAKAAGLKLITWTLERSGQLGSGGGWYYQSTTPVIDRDGDTFRMLDVLARDVGIEGIFSDWPATVTYYANCMDLD